MQAIKPHVKGTLSLSIFRCMSQRLDLSGLYVLKNANKLAVRNNSEDTHFISSAKSSVNLKAFLRYIKSIRPVAGWV